MEIMPNNLKRQYDLHAAAYEQKALEVLRSGWYVLGKEVQAFEAEWASYIGTDYCVGVASGLDALILAFRLLGVGPGDEVIVSANAYIACVMGITINGASPVFVEPDAYDNLDASKIEAAVTAHTKAILAVHLYGQACDMDAVCEVARRHHLRVVEDCAQSHGNHWNGRTVGTFGDIGCFSFYPSKGCGAFGDAGCLVTNDAQLAANGRMLRNYGSRVRYHNETVGMNSRLDELQAGLLRVKLSYLPALNEERCRIAARYNEALQNPLVTPLRVRPGADCTWHQYVVHVPKGRDALAAYLKERGIGTIIHYPIPPHLSEAYISLGYRAGDFPIAERYAAEVLSLPMYNGITEAEQHAVIDAVNAWPGEEG